MRCRKAGRAQQNHLEHPPVALKFKHNLRVWRAENARPDDRSGHADTIEAIHPHELVTGLHPPIIRQGTTILHAANMAIVASRIRRLQAHSHAHSIRPLHCHGQSRTELMGS
jgi:hypothetical protein